MPYFNFVQDLVAGKTGKQIEAAKRAQSKRLGQSGAAGKSKRCKKGKSCGATCISGSKVCLVDLPWVSSNGLTKVSKKIQDASGKKPKSEPKVEPTLKKPGITLSPLTTLDDLKNKVTETWTVADNAKLTEDSKEVAKILEKRNSSYPQMALYDPGDNVKYDAIKDGIGRQLWQMVLEESGGGRDKYDPATGRMLLNDGKYVLDRFTADYDKSYAIRQADRGNPAFNHHRDDADALDRLLRVKELPRTEVEKFRGFRATPERLQEMVDGAKNKESFKQGSVNSWSSAMRVGQQFANREINEHPDRTERVIFRTINKRGVPIEFVTSVTNEDEILTPRNTDYKYMGYRSITTEAGRVYHIFDVEEMP
jgi:hypothetical protein